MKVTGIYKITSPNGNIYIGQAKHIYNRWTSYRRLDCKTQVKLHNSFLKYGVENHKFEIIHECNEEELNELEIHYIKLYDTFNTEHGLNLLAGGHNGSPSIETREKISNFHKNKIVSEETKKKISDSNKGKKKSPEQVKKMADSKRGKKKSVESIRRQADAIRGIKRSPEIIAKILETKKRIKDEQIKNGTYKKRVVTEEQRRNQSEKLKGRFSGEKHPFYGRKLSDEHKNKLINGLLGKKQSPETIEKRINTMLKNKNEKIKNGTSEKRKFSNETKERMRESKLGTKQSEEQIRKRNESRMITLQERRMMIF